MRVAKNKPAAAIITTQPPIVKIVVPIPPVDGKLEILVLTISTFLTVPIAGLSSVTVKVDFTVWSSPEIVAPFTEIDQAVNLPVVGSIVSSITIVYTVSFNVYPLGAFVSFK